MPKSPNSPSPIRIPIDPRSRDFHVPTINGMDHNDLDSDSERYVTSTMIPAVQSPPSEALYGNKTRVEKTATPEQITELVMAINNTPLNFELLKELQFVFNSNDFNQSRFPNCWAVAVLKALMETKAGPAILNYMIKEFNTDTKLVPQADTPSPSQTDQDDSRPRYIVRTPTLDSDFFQLINKLVANVLSEQSGEPYKAIIQGIMQMFHLTNSVRFKHKNPIPILNQIFFTEKVPVATSLEEAMSDGWFTPHLIYRLFKNLTQDIFIVTSTSDESKVNFLLDRIFSNPGYHVSFASLKRELQYHNHAMLAGKNLPEYLLEKQHAYTIHSVTDSHVVLINPWHSGQQIILERSEFKKLFHTMSSAFLPKDIKSYDSIHLSSQTPIHIEKDSNYLKAEEGTWRFPLKPYFTPYQPLTRLSLKGHNFFIVNSQNGPILHELDSRKPLFSVKTSSPQDPLSFSDVFLDHDHLQIDVNSFEITQDIIVSLGFYGGNLTVEFNSDTDSESSSESETEEKADSDDANAYITFPHKTCIGKNKTYQNTLKEFKSPFAFRYT